MMGGILHGAKAFVRTFSAQFSAKMYAVWCLFAFPKYDGCTANHCRRASGVFRDRMVVVIQLQHPAKGLVPSGLPERIRRFASHAKNKGRKE